MTEAAAEFESPEPAPAPGPVEPAAPQPLTAGAQLMQAREAAGLSRADVAGKLKFSVKQIETIEADNYAALGGPTFVRGLVRTYAKLLNADAGPILAALERSELPPETGQVAADVKGIPFPSAKPPASPILRYVVISVGVIAAGILLLYFWHGEELWSGPMAILPVTRKPAIAQSAPAAPATDVALNPEVIDTPPPPRTEVRNAPPPPLRTAVPANLALPRQGTDKPVAQTVQKPAEQAAPKPADQAAAKPAALASNTNGGASGSGKRIELSFARDSWVEVRDAGGRILFSQLNLAGSEQTVEGRAPFELVIGNAAYVKLRYRDEPVDLKPYTKAEVARINLK